MQQYPAAGSGHVPVRAGLRAGTAVLALDLGASRIRVAVVAADGHLLQRFATETPGERTSAAVGDTCVEALQHVRAEAARDDGDPVVAVGISAIGPVDPWQGVILDPPNMGSHFRNVPLAGMVAEALGLPAVLDRDTNVAALGEQAYGAARGVDDFLYLTVSTGLGGAIVQNGMIVRGPDGTAGELGHLPIDIDGPPCGCGARGHLEAISSGSGIARAALEAVERGACPVLRDRARRNGIERISAADVAEAEDAGDPDAAAIMAYARRAFAEAMVGLVDMFDPSRVIVGGSVARTQGDRWLQPARDAVRERAFRAPARRVKIVPAALGDDVGLLGAVPLIRTRLWPDAPARAVPGSARHARPSAVQERVDAAV